MLKSSTTSFTGQEHQASSKTRFMGSSPAGTIGFRRTPRPARLPTRSNRHRLSFAIPRQKITRWPVGAHALGRRTLQSMDCREKNIIKMRPFDANGAFDLPRAILAHSKAHQRPVLLALMIRLPVLASPF